MFAMMIGIDMAANLSTTDPISSGSHNYRVLQIVNPEEEQRKAMIWKLNERLEKLRNG